MRKISALLLCLLLLSLSLVCAAREMPDPTRTGSLTLEMTWEGSPLNSGSLTLCRVGDIAAEGADDVFVPVSQLKDAGVSLRDPGDTALPQQLADLADQYALPTVSAPIESGTAYFASVQPGLYLVTQSEAADGFAPIRPFLISLPRWDGSTYIYDVSAQPKVSLEPLPTQPTSPTEPSNPTEPSDPKLPQTGQLSWPIPVMAVAGMFFVIVGCLLCFGKKGHDED